MKRKLWMKALTLVVMLLMFSMSAMGAFAAKPVKQVTITTGDFERNLFVGDVYKFDVSAKYGATAENLTWTTVPSTNPVVIHEALIKGGEKATIEYTASAAGDFTVYVIVSDSKSSDQLTAIFHVQGTTENHPPTANDLTLTTVQDQTVTGTITATDPDSDPLSGSLTTPPTKGIATINGLTVTYTPNPGIYGTDTFTVTVSDGKGGLDTALVTVIIDQAPPDTLKYVALGDSIPDGIYYTSLWNYLSGGTNSYSYVEQLAAHLEVAPGDFTDASVSGQHTIDVFNQIAGMEQTIREADVITLCVGANEIMDAAARSLSGLEKYNINWSVADAGRVAFERDWPQLINRIEDLNSDVTLIVMTIYNPYRLTDSYFPLVDPYFSSSEAGDFGLNYIIASTMALDNASWGDLLADDFDYRIADVYTAFNNYSNKDSLTGFYSSFCDPHPNQTGQNLIYQTHLSALSNQ